MTTRRTKQEERADAVAVADDQEQEQGGTWLRDGAWVAIQCADPVYYGRIVKVTPTHYFLDECSWVAHLGRASVFYADPTKREESEYIGEYAVERPVVGIARMPVDGRRLENKPE